jgi:Zn-dependent peptidase ImmA (M78 family)
MDVSPETLVRCVRAAERTLAKYAHEHFAPPVDIEYVASQLGFQVLRIHSAADEFSGLISPKHKLIGVNGNHHRHRQRFTLGHELAHIILKHPPESRCVQKEIAEYNREADVFASELLIPTQLLIRCLSRTTATSMLSKKRCR